MSAKLLSALLLQHARTFEFHGNGFSILVCCLCDESSEGQWVILRTNTVVESVLCEIDDTSHKGLVWCARKDHANNPPPDTFLPIGYEELHDAAEVALQIIDNAVDVEEWEWQRHRIFDSGNYRILHPVEDGQLTKEIALDDVVDSFRIDYGGSSPFDGGVTGPHEIVERGEEGGQFYFDYYEVRRGR